MLPHYEDLKKNLEIFHGESGHIRPHLHKSLECIYVTEGTLELASARNYITWRNTILQWFFQN